MTLLSKDPTYVSQVGGDHYGTKYGHWDYCKDAQTGYLEGHATKYLYRWPRKGGIQDLEKALSFVEKLMVGNEHTNCDRGVEEFDTKLGEFFDQNNVPKVEQALIYQVLHWETYADLVKVRDEIIAFIGEQVAASASHRYTNQG